MAMGGFFGSGAPAEQGLGAGFFGKLVTAPTTTLDALVDLAFTSGSRVVGVTATGNAAWSSDGGLTTHAVFTPLPNINAFSIVLGDGAGHAVAIGQDPNLGARLVTTIDGGQSWTDTTPPGMVGGVLALYYSATLALFFATPAASGVVVFSSPDGVTWTAQAVVSGVQSIVTQFVGDRIVETGGLIYVGGLGVNRSADGINFTNVKSPVGGTYDDGPVLNGSVFGVGLLAAFFPAIVQFFTSPDGTTWTAKSFAISPFTAKPYIRLDQYNGEFITGISQVDQQTFASSADAATWVDHTANVSGFQATSGPVFLSTAGALYLFGKGIVHTIDYSSYALDVAVTNTVNNMKAFAGHVAGCGADATGQGAFFKVL